MANRNKILDAARDAFARSPDASLNSIAKLAGVGPGTLYRHFPNREALVIGVYRHEIEALVTLAPKLTAQHPPVEAFRLWCDRLASYGRVKHGLTDVLHSAAAAPVHAEVYGPMVGAVGHLVTACQAVGAFRPDIEAEDVLLLLAFLWRIKDPDADPSQAERMLDLVIRGLEAR
nr:TetR/AcrR family transcriptional regulator [Acuticoccus mangrovi]